MIWIMGLDFGYWLLAIGYHFVVFHHKQAQAGQQAQGETSTQETNCAVGEHLHGKQPCTAGSQYLSGMDTAKIKHNVPNDALNLGAVVNVKALHHSNGSRKQQQQKTKAGGIKQWKGYGGQ